jgi:DNA-binding NarL/FixJ family response regulator
LVYFLLVESAVEPLRVVLADDHHFYREGLRELLAAAGMTVVGETDDGAHAVSLALELEPDVVVIDLKMPTSSGVDALSRIASQMSGAQLVALTMSDDETDVLDALDAGACSYLLKDTRTDELVASIRLAARGHAVLSRDVVRALATRARAADAAPCQTNGCELSLTARELEVIRLIADGSDNAAIGRELSISRHTVKRYVTNILQKLGAHSRVQAAVFAVRNGLA